MNNLYKFILTLFLTLPVLIFGQFHIKENLNRKWIWSKLGQRHVLC